MIKGIWKECPRGHRYLRKSSCPVCPKCWPGFYKKHGTGEFNMLSAPAQRALHNAGIKTLKQLTRKSERAIRDLHGMGPNGVAKIKKAMKLHELSFAKPKKT